LPKSVFKQIIIGCEMKKEEKQQIIEIANEYLPTCELYQAEKLEYSFGLKLNKIQSLSISLF
jgi:hypothetical protein